MALKQLLRPLGSTGLMVSALGLGTVKFGRNQGVKYPQPFELPDDRQCLNLLSEARGLGINLLDTAPAYGISEQRLGKFLAGRRDDWVLVSKVGEEFSAGRSRFDFSAAATRASVERSLRRLATDRLDAVLIHSDGNDLAILQQEDCLATLLQLKTAGLIRAVGFSGKTITGGLLALEHCDLLMVTYNLLYQDELPVIRAAHAAGKGVLIKKGLMSGHLAESRGDDAVFASLHLLLQERGVSSVVIGTLNPIHLRANITAAGEILATIHQG
jgi:aryl-alcohol dehydrogenase-like predicted oxidoreductase